MYICMYIYIYVLDEQVVGRAYPRKDATWPRAPDQEGHRSRGPTASTLLGVSIIGGYLKSWMAYFHGKIHL